MGIKIFTSQYRALWVGETFTEAGDELETKLIIEVGGKHCRVDRRDEIKSRGTHRWGTNREEHHK